jgi:hypothetical protein
VQVSAVPQRGLSGADEEAQKFQLDYLSTTKSPSNDRSFDPGLQNTCSGSVSGKIQMPRMSVNIGLS